METTLRYEEAGSGPALLLIHGFPHDRRLWRDQLKTLSGHARVIAPDLRGFGQAAEVPRTMTMDLYAADLKALLEELGVEQAVVAGLSMGGYVALAFLARYPRAVSALALCHTKAGADSEEARQGREATIKKVENEGMHAVAEAMLPKMLAPDTLRTRNGPGDFVRTMMEQQPAQGCTAALRGMAERPDRSALLPDIAVPTLVITGSEDAAIPPSESATMASAIPGATLITVPQAGHLSNLERPEVFDQAILDLLARLS